MKGVVEAVSALLISGILIGVVGTVYFWGVPLIQKNKDVSVLESTEDFMQELNDVIKSVANVGGRNQLQFNSPGLIRFNGETLVVIVDTEGTIYAAEAEVPLSKNSPSIDEGIWGEDNPEAIKVVAQQITGTKFRNTYTLDYIPLKVNPLEGPVKKIFEIKMSGTDSSGGQGSFVIISSAGTDENEEDGIVEIIAVVNVDIK